MSEEEEWRSFFSNQVKFNLRGGTGTSGGKVSCKLNILKNAAIRKIIEKAMEEGQTLDEVLESMNGALTEIDEEISIVRKIKDLAEKASLFQHGLLKQTEEKGSESTSEENVTPTVGSSNSSVVLQSPNGSREDLPSPSQPSAEEFHGTEADQKDEEEKARNEIQAKVDKMLALLEPDEQSESSDSSGEDAPIEPEKSCDNVAVNSEENFIEEGLSGGEGPASSTSAKKTFEEEQAEILGCHQQ